MGIDKINFAALNAMQQTNKTGEAKGTDKMGTIPMTKSVSKSDDFYGGMVQLNNKVPAYTGLESTVAYLDYLTKFDVL